MPKSSSSRHTNDASSSSMNSRQSSRSKGSKKSKGSRGRSGSVRTSQSNDDHPDLAQLEQRLTEDVDVEFFQDPRKFHTIHRVIDVLGMQLGDVVMTSTSPTNNDDYLSHNPAYRALRDQQEVVEEAIEHLALMHCTDLNGSVVQVGRVARQFHDAVSQVRGLRRQVLDIQETLGAPPNDDNNNNSHSRNVTASSTAASAMSLRELWLKKLESEAVLSLLGKLDRIRAAPLQFDAYLQCSRIGAAVTTVAHALDTMFSSDVSQVQALHKIMEQLMMRKQKAEEVVWELLLDVLFLRTANGAAQRLLEKSQQGGTAGTAAVTSDMKDSVTITSKDSGPNSNTKNRLSVATTTNEEDDEYAHVYNPYGMHNPFLSSTLRFALDYDLQVEPHRRHAGSTEEDVYEEDLALPSTTLVCIPSTTMEAEFDLEQEERRHLEEEKYAQFKHLHNTGGKEEEEKQSSSHNNRNSKPYKPHYGDPILALRTLVECLVRLRRMDDVERIVTEALEEEVSRLVQREQARTFLRVELAASGTSKTGRYALLMRKVGATTDLRDFRTHLQHMVAAFGNVQVRLIHLAQIVRHRLVADKTRSAAFADPTAALENVLQHSKDLMEKEIKDFLNACLQDTPEKEPEFNINALTNVSGQSRQIAARTKASKKLGLESGLFSLGIIETNEQTETANAAEAWLTSSTSSRRTTIQNMSTPKFVQEILFSKTTQNGRPQIRHALFFRKALNKWQHDNVFMRKQLTMVTKEDASRPPYYSPNEVPALSFLDNVIQKDLLPVLQEEAVNGTVQALERPDAFDPVLDRNVYASADTNEPQDVDMCRACTALYNFTGPLFLALHRLPKGGDMYLPLVAVLEHVILTFISRVKQQMSRICNDKTALQLLMETAPETEDDGKPAKAFGNVMERRKAFAQLVLAYADADALEAAASDEAGELSSGVPKLAPSASDTPRNDSKAAALAGISELDLVGGVEREEANLSMELMFVKPFLEFAGVDQSANITTCSDEHLMKGACLAHSLLKLSSLLDSRLKVRSHLGVSTKTLTNTRALREAIKTINVSGLKMAKFCRTDILLQSVVRLAKVCNSSTIVARDAVRIPSSVNDLGEYMTAASDNLREAAGNAVTAYTFSTLEQYIPLCLIQTVRVLAAGKGIVLKAPLTMNGIEALDRSGSVLYRDLKGATSFDNSFWDIELAAVSFERSASFIAMMELEMAELEAYFQENRDDFSDQDFQLMFSMNGPRRKGDIGRYHMLVKKLDRE